MNKTERPSLRTAFNAAIPVLLGLATVMLAAPAFAQGVTATGNLDFSTLESSLPVNSTVTTTYLGTSSRPGFVSNTSFTEGSGSSQATFSFSGTSGIFSGSTSGVAAAPVGTNGQPVTAEYMAAGPGGAVTVNYAAQQSYFGLLWGSVDSYNTISFYNNGTAIGSLSGTQIAANANGNQGAAGSYVVNVDAGNGKTFNEVVLTSSSPAFEFDNISYSTVQQAILPAPLRLAGATPAGLAVLMLGSLWFLRRRRPA